MSIAKDTLRSDDLPSESSIHGGRESIERTSYNSKYPQEKKKQNKSDDILSQIHSMRQSGGFNSTPSNRSNS